MAEVKIKRIETLYDSGTAKDSEDGLVIAPPFFGVIDGLSAPYSPEVEKFLFDGMSGGQMVQSTALQTFYGATPNSSLKEVILRANQIVGQTQTLQGIPPDQAGRLAGASFVFLKVESDSIQIFQAGDSLAVWSYSSGEVGATENQAYGHVSKNLATIAELMERHCDNRGKMWVEFCPILSERRYRDFNKRTRTGFAVLNGQQTIERFWQEITLPTQRLERILLFTDGFIWKYEETANPMKIAERMIHGYQGLSLSAILNAKRAKEVERIRGSYVDEEEATALNLHFQ